MDRRLKRRDVVDGAAADKPPWRISRRLKQRCGSCHFTTSHEMSPEAFYGVKRVTIFDRLRGAA